MWFGIGYLEVTILHIVVYKHVDFLNGLIEMTLRKTHHINVVSKVALAFAEFDVVYVT